MTSAAPALDFSVLASCGTALWTSTRPTFFDPGSTRHIEDRDCMLVARVPKANPVQSEVEAIANADAIGALWDLVAEFDRLTAEGGRTSFALSRFALCTPGPWKSVPAPERDHRSAFHIHDAAGYLVARIDRCNPHLGKETLAARAAAVCMVPVLLNEIRRLATP